MPHVGSGGSDDLASSDEIKVFKDEGEDEQKLSENLTDDKSSLITEGETEKAQIPQQSYSSSKNAHVSRSVASPSSGKSFEPIPHSIGYVVSPYAHANGALGSMANKVSMVGQPHPASPLPFMMYNTDTFAQPPPAHMGIPPVHIDPKTGLPLMTAHAFQHITWKEVLEHQGIPRPPMYPLAPPGQYPHHLFSPDFPPQLQWPLLSRHSPSMYPMTSAGFRSTYPTTLGPSALPRFPPPTLIQPHPGIPTHPSFSHHAIITPGPKQEVATHHSHENNRHSSSYHLDQKPPHLKMSESHTPVSHSGSSPISQNHSSNHHNGESGPNRSSSSQSSNNNHHHHSSSKKDKNHIKKPLNAFMLYMKEMRAKVVAECTLKESAAINQILGRRWHSLSRDEQAKYYEMARKERQLHMQLYPGWSARDNYAQNCKKKKRKKDKSHEGADGNNPKKCRARYGLDKQSSWCKPCRRKKKCIRYMDMSDSGGQEGEVNLGSVESIEAPTPDSKSTLSEDSQHSSAGSDLAHTSSELSLSSPPPAIVPSDIVEQKPILLDNSAVLRHSFHRHFNHSALSHAALNHMALNHAMALNHNAAMNHATSMASSLAVSCSGVSPLHSSHPLSVHHLTQSHNRSSNDESDSNLPQLPTPPSTDSSTTTAAPQMLTVT